MQFKLTLLILIFSGFEVVSAPEINKLSVPVQDSMCNSGGVFCITCDSSLLASCYISDPQQLLEGFYSCTPAYLGQGPQTEQPSPLCYGAGVPHNMSWFAFRAYSDVAYVMISPYSCTTGQGAVGLQSGIYDLCAPEGGQCIAGNPFCSTGFDPVEYKAEGLVPGRDYYLFVDGCNGAECEYLIIIDQEPPCLIDSPKDIALISRCPAVDSSSLYCDISQLDLSITHFGDLPPFGGPFDEEDAEYDPSLNFIQYWSSNPPFNGWDTTFAINNIDSPFISDVLAGALVNIDYTLCLDSLQSLCYTKVCDNCCVSFKLIDCGSDYDQDGYDIPEDCNDCDPSVNPEAIEIPGNDIDENCDGDLESSSNLNVSKHDFSIYPNPTKDEIYFNSSYPYTLIINIYDVRGNLVESMKAQKSISISHLPKGTYVLKFNFPTEDYSIVRKILKL